ncbi:MAG TPA: deoxyhypusine synthase [Candidatus Aenigmarchaeota archaeon]|nr:deoxyhypusine synthase [Candidatus Aenigmarchaeota archaeon]
MKGMNVVKDYDIENIKSMGEFVDQLKCAGFQATHTGIGREIIKKMMDKDVTVFISFTANMVASGLRGIFAEMCKKRFVDVIITTGGAVEHDFIRGFDPYYIGSFDMDDRELHKRGINRLGNIVVPNERYILLEEKIQKLLTKLYEKKRAWSPSEFILELGKISKESSFIYWAARNNIPIFCPGITDSAIGLQFYFFKQDHADFCIDVSGDMKTLADIVFNANKTGGIILGGGIAKHHTIGVNIVRGGLDYAVYVTTAQVWDGSLSGAKAKEAVSWGKINEEARYVTIYGDATIVFPLLIYGLI